MAKLSVAETSQLVRKRKDAKTLYDKYVYPNRVNNTDGFVCKHFQQFAMKWLHRRCGSFLVH